MRRAASLAAGIAMDAFLGDPPTSWHPVGLLGLAIRRLYASAPHDDMARRRYGLGVATGLPTVAGAVTTLARRIACELPLGGVLFDALMVDATSAPRGLMARAGQVQEALESDDLDAARELCARHLVSRETSTLSQSEIAGATIESVAENFCDGVIAPWLAFSLAGASGAVAYRAVNTLDSLWGYRSDEFEDLGSAAARLDDVLNLVPSRLAALAIIAAAAIPRYGRDCSASEAFACWRSDAAQTTSPNAGQPMAAMAGALGVRLSKQGEYILGADFREPRAEDIERAVRLARGAATLAGAGLIGALLATGAS